MATFQFGSYSFPTKTAVREEIRRRIASYPDNLPMGPADVDFFVELVKLHRQAIQKLGPGVAGVEVRTNPPPYSNRGLWLRRVDGTETDVSWTQILSPSSPRTDRLKAARNAVQADIRKWRMTALTVEPRCAITGEPLNTSNSDVDHAAPVTFESLVDTFFGDAFPEVNETVDGDIFTRFVDGRVSDWFAEYHREHAKLRLVRRDLNRGYLRRKC